MRYRKSASYLRGVQINLVECNFLYGNRLGVFMESKFFWWNAILLLEIELMASWRANKSGGVQFRPAFSRIKQGQGDEPGRA